VVASEHQLSLAIGKEGQNARLAARLSGFKVDIRSDNEGGEESEPPEAVAEEAVVDEAVLDEAVLEATDDDAVEPEVETSPEASDDEDAVEASEDDESE